MNDNNNVCPYCNGTGVAPCDDDYELPELTGEQRETLTEMMNKYFSNPERQANMEKQIRANKEFITKMRNMK